MYARFYRWAMDRVDKNGIVAFITNRSFIDSRTFDGFRKIIQEEFSNCYIIDTRSDVRANPKIAGTTHNVFGIQTGVAVMFLIKKEKQESKCRIEYTSMEDNWRKEIKLDWFRNNRFEEILFEKIDNDKNNNWINLSENDWESMISVCDKNVKGGKSKKALFELFTNGIVTNRDQWVYDINEKNLLNKMRFFSQSYNHNIANEKFEDEIKWSRDLKNEAKRKRKSLFDDKKIREVLYRPYVKSKYYSEFIFSDMLTGNHYDFFGKDLKRENTVIGFLSIISSNPLSTLASTNLMDLCLLKQGNGGTQCLPLYRYTSTGERIDNITDWGLQQFTDYYKNENIAKIDLFHYTYAVLHNPAYRKKYELNLKREFPRIPFYENFFQWRDWGKQLMDLHINYEIVQPYDLTQHNYQTKTETNQQKAFFTKAEEPEVLYARQPKIKVKLKADKASGIIEIDELTLLRGVPKEAWEYKLGNRSALEWILDQYKEKKPTDPTIAEKFNTYKFADYKEKVIDLLKRVCTVSVETMKIVREMEGINE